MKGTLAFIVALLLVGGLVLMFGGGWAMQATGLATVQTSNGTYLVTQQEAAARIGADVAWQQEQAAAAAAADRENTGRWTLFGMAAAGLVLLAVVGISVGFAIPAIQRQQATTARLQAESRAYARYLAAGAPVPAHLLNQSQGAILDLLPEPYEGQPARAQFIERRQ